MAGLRQIQEQQEKWNAEGKGGGGEFNAIYPKKDDLVFYHFMSTGEDNDPYFEVYFAHELPPAKEGAFSTLKYCPVESGHDENYPCKYCAAGIKTKKRMAMWLHVSDHLHAAPVQGLQLETIQYNGRNYFLRRINEPRIWETSAWRESCLTDIIFQGASMGNLHNAQFQLITTGDGRDRRYKVVALFNSPPFDRATYEADKPKCTPVIPWLMESIKEMPMATGDAPVYQRETAGAPAAAPAPAAAAYQPAPQAQSYAPPAAPTQPTMMQPPAQPAQQYQPAPPPPQQAPPAQQYAPPQATAGETPAPATEPWETGDKVGATDGPLPDLAQPAAPPNAKSLF